MSDRRKPEARRPYGWPRPPKPEWQVPQVEIWGMITRPHFARRPQVEIKWRVPTSRGHVTVVRRVR